MIGVEVDIGTPTSDPLYNTYKWGATASTSGGTLTGGTAAGNFSDVIYATTANDKINGLGGNDALAGSEGSDNIDGGEGDDLIAGGAGSDSILGGPGNDFINSSGGLSVQARLRPTDTWSGPPAGQTVLAQGATWGVYVETPSAGAADTLTIWSGATNPAGTDGDFVDGGAGNDRVIAGGGMDFVQGGNAVLSQVSPAATRT